MPQPDAGLERNARGATRFLIFVALAAACQDGIEPARPTTLEAAEGNDQGAVVGGIAAIDPVFRVLDQYGSPLPGVRVDFTVSEGEGSVAVASAETNALGRVSPGAWTLGTRVGRNAITAKSGRLAPAQITAHSTAASAASIVIVSGDAQQGTVGMATPVPLVLRVTDAWDNAVAGARVRIVGTAENGSVDNADVSTDAAGIAMPGRWTLGRQAGPQFIEAEVDGGPRQTLRATARPGAAHSLVVAEGDNQRAPVTTAVTVAPAVRIVDSFGNAVGGADVRFEVVSGDGSVDGPQSESAASTSNDAGIARVATWVMGARAGTNVLRATLHGSASAVSFTATGTAAAPAALDKVDGDAQTAAVGENTPLAPAVRVRDAHGNPVPGADVRFTTTDGGTIANATATTDENGLADAGAWRLGPAQGTQRLTASHGALSSIIFSATATAATSGGGGSGGGSGGSGGGSGGSQPGSYDVAVIFSGSLSGTQQMAFYEGIGRWAGVLRSELPDISISVPANACGVPHAAINQMVDDLLILVTVAPIDGPGNILGSAGPCIVRASGGMPAVGAMHLDAADVAQLESAGRLSDVVAHEVGHIIGIGTRWGTLLSGAGGSDPRFTGYNSISAFTGSGGSSYPGLPVPVENSGGPGTRDGHWRESVFRNELMTGWLNQGSNPLSVISVAALQDLGYIVDPANADGFSISAAEAATDASANRPAFEIREQPLRIQPITVDARGRPVTTRALPVMR
jgi:hypothetical protein